MPECYQPDYTPHPPSLTGSKNVRVGNVSKWLYITESAGEKKVMFWLPVKMEFGWAEKICSLAI